ncbi:glycosyltransferase family 4 protein [Psychroserpens sp.]|jgi:glycosyltransferase involved in cell wall biosynthesis|uniref:glycosyltransferase family 4 protein n=1 Tax=Psychroserpens sp. TaxID=2020870 RepID=UPI0039E6D0BF
MVKSRVASVIIQDGSGGIEVVSKLNTECNIEKINDDIRSGILGSQYGIFFRLGRVLSILRNNDVVITNLPMHHMFFSLCNILYKKKLIGVEHGPWVFVISAKSSIVLSWFYHLWLSKSKLPIICVSKDLLAVYNLIRKNNHYIPNCISFIDNVKTNSLISDKCKFVFVGRFDYQKDVTLAIESYIAYRKRFGNDCSLELFGDGSELDALKEHYKREDSIFFHGYNANARNELYKFDVCLVTSKFEGLPGIVLEALHVGCRVVCAPFISGLMELSIYPNLIITNDREIDSFVESTEQILKADYEVKQVRTKLETYYSHNKVRQKYSKIISKLNI